MGREVGPRLAKRFARAVLELAEAGDTVDTVTVANRLRVAGLLDETGGPDYLHQLFADTPSISGAATYAGIVADCARARRMLRTAADLADAAALLHETRRKLFGILAEQPREKAPAPAAKIHDVRCLDLLKGSQHRSDPVFGEAHGRQLHNARTE